MLGLIEEAAQAVAWRESMNWIEGLAEEFADSILSKRLTIPAADLPQVAQDTANYTADGTALTVDQMTAADKAVIAYCLHKAVNSVLGKL